MNHTIDGKKEEMYTVKNVSKLCHVTVRTLRYYDNIGLVTPEHDDKIGTRLYSKKDIINLQEVLTLKLIGFSLAEIKEIIHEKNGSDFHDRLKTQGEILQKKVEGLSKVVSMINMIKDLAEHEEVEYEHILKIIKTIKSAEISINQYKDYSNLEARIKLHEVYSTNNKMGWYEWCFTRIKFENNMKVLEVGCGNGQFWLKNRQFIDRRLDITLTDIEKQMISRAKKNLKEIDINLKYKVADVTELPYKDNSFDVVMANHMLYHAQDTKKAVAEIYRILKPGGCAYMTTIGADHLKELKDLIHSVDAGKTREQWRFLDSFNLDTGYQLLKMFFGDVQTSLYYDNLIVDKAEPIISYVKSMEDKNNIVFEGKNLKILKARIDEKILQDNGFFITKQTGMLIARK